MQHSLPELDTDIAQPIIEMAAAQSYAAAKSLALVSRTVSDWALNVMYRKVVLRHPEAVKLFFSYTQVGSRSVRFRSHVRTVALSNLVAWRDAKAVIDLCPNATEIIYTTDRKGEAITFPASVTKLVMNPACFYGPITELHPERFSFSPSIFKRLTHLFLILDSNLDFIKWDWSTISSMHSLTCLGLMQGVYQDTLDTLFELANDVKPFFPPSLSTCVLCVDRLVIDKAWELPIVVACKRYRDGISNSGVKVQPRDVVFLDSPFQGGLDWFLNEFASHRPTLWEAVDAVAARQNRCPIAVAHREASVKRYYDADWLGYHYGACS